MELGRILIDEEFLPAAKETIYKATKSIRISTFKAEITTKPRGRKLSRFFDLLFQKALSGVDVRVLINRTNPRGSIPISNLYATKELPKHKIKVRCLRNDRICHAKLIIVDGLTAILGSHNLSVKSCHNNFEVSYYFQDFYIVSNLHQTFDKVWENSQKV